MAERNKHEANVNAALIGGIIFHKDKKLIGASQALMNLAHEHRMKSQQTQRQMDHSKAHGRINKFQESMDLHQYNKEKHYREDWNKPEYKEMKRKKRERERDIRISYRAGGNKKQKSSVSDLNTSPSHSNN